MRAGVLWMWGLLLSQAAGAAQPPPPEGRPLALPEAYGLALRRSEELAIREEATAEALAQADELWAAIKPRLKVSATELVQDAPASQAGFSSSFNQRSRFDARLSARQPLFSGLREYMAFKAAQARGDAAAAAKARSESLLYQDVAQAYGLLLGLQKEISTRLALADITRDRIAELKSRAKLGRSRESEVLAAESQLALIEAQVQAVRGSERVSQEALRFFTGLEEDLRPRDLPVPTRETLQPHLDKAASRPDVRARRRELDAASWTVPVVSRQRWPSVGLDGNYYLKRSGIQESVKWDFLVAAEMPLYAGGAVGAQVRQAESRRRAAELAAALAQRQAEREVRSAWREIESALASVESLEKAAALAESNARAQAEDYRLGQVTNLDVLGSLNALQETRLKLDQARLEAALARVRLGVAAGSAP